MDQAVEIRGTELGRESIQHPLGTSNGNKPIMNKYHIWSVLLFYHSGTMSNENPHPANLLQFDYLDLATPAPVPIIDVHTHLSGVNAVRCYHEMAAAYGITLTFSMSPLDQVEAIREIMGDAVEFIAIPAWGEADRVKAHGPAFLEQIRRFHDAGSRIVKFWAAPRGRDYGHEVGEPELLHLDSPARRKAMDVAAELGMIFMTHVADPDTWFQSKYSDSTRYGTKEDQYEPLERLLDIYQQPWIAAHMGGWPEDLDFLDGLLARHDNLHLDSSATKWMIRELSRHAPDRLCEFLTRWKGRVLFGSDIVTNESHLAPPEVTADGVVPQATSLEEARDLYASRYWALRTLFESKYDGPSPIADPDLALVEPDRHGPLDSPALHGKSLPVEVLRSLYHAAAADLLLPRIRS